MKIGDLVKFRYVASVITPVCRNIKESVGMVLSLGTTPSVLDSESGKVLEAFLIVEVISDA